jgi:hypothetical protein
LQPREADFIDSMMHWREQPSQKQLDWLADIYRRLERKRRRAEGPDFKDRIKDMLEGK